MNTSKILKFTTTILFILSISLFSSTVFAGTPTDETPCKELFEGQNIKEKGQIEMMFFIHGYSGEAAFLIALKPMIEGMLAIEPMKSNSHLFNFWYAFSDKLPKRENLESAKKELMQGCSFSSDNTVFEVSYASQLSKSGPAGAGTFETKSASINFLEPKRRGGYSEEVIAFQSYLLTHELIGHALAGLVDEYNLVSDTTASHAAQISDGINCFVGTYNQCLEKSPWADLVGQGCGEPDKIDCVDQPQTAEVGCYEGCRLLTEGAFRPHDQSIMNEQKKDFFGLVHQREICKQLQELTNSATGFCYKEFGIGVEPAQSNITDRISPNLSATDLSDQIDSTGSKAVRTDASSKFLLIGIGTISIIIVLLAGVWLGRKFRAAP